MRKPIFGLEAEQYAGLCFFLAKPCALPLFGRTTIYHQFQATCFVWWIVARKMLF